MTVLCHHLSILLLKGSSFPAESSSSKYPLVGTGPTHFPPGGKNKKDWASCNSWGLTVSRPQQHPIFQPTAAPYPLPSWRSQHHSHTRSTEHRVPQPGQHAGFLWAFCMCAPWHIQRRERRWDISVGAPKLLPALWGSEGGGMTAIFNTCMFKSIKKHSAKLQ